MIDIEMFVAIAAVIIALFSLVATLISTAFQQRHNRNSVTPIIDFPTCFSFDTMFVKIKNAGTGPMIIKSVYVEKAGEKQKSVRKSFDIKDIETLERHYNYDHGHIRSHKILTPNEEFRLLYFNLIEKHETAKPDNELAQAVQRTLDTFKKLTIVVTYEDIYQKVVIEGIEVATGIVKKYKTVPNTEKAPSKTLDAEN